MGNGPPTPLRQAFWGVYPPQMSLRRLIATIAALVCGAAEISCSGSERPPQMAFPQEIRASDLVRWIEDAGVPRTDLDWAEIDRLHDVHLGQILRVRTAAARALRDIAPCTYEFNDVNWPQLLPEQARAAASVQTRLLAESRALEEEFLFSLRSVRGVAPCIPPMLVARRGLERIHQLASASHTAGSLYPATREDPLTLLASELRRAAGDGGAHPSSLELCTAFTEIAGRSQPTAERWWQSVGAFSMAAALEYERAVLLSNVQQEAQTQPADSDAQSPPAALDADLPPLPDTTKQAVERAVGRLIDYQRAVADAIDSHSSSLPAPARTATTEVLLDNAMQFVQPHVMIAIRVATDHPTCSAATREALKKIRQRIHAAQRSNESLASLRSTLERASVSLSEEVQGNEDLAKAVQFALQHGRAPDPTATSAPQSDEPEEEPRLSVWRDLGALPHRIDTERVCALGTAAGLDRDTCLVIAAAGDARFRALEKDLAARVEQGETEAMKHDRGDNDKERTRTAQRAVQTYFRHLQSARGLVTDADTALLEDIRLRCALQGLPARPATMLFEALRASCAPSPQSIRRRLGGGWFRFHVVFDTLPAGCIALLVIDEELPQRTRELLGGMMAVYWDELLPAMRDTSVAREQALRDILQLVLVHRSDRDPESRAALAAILRRYRSSEAVWERIEDRIVDEVCSVLSEDGDARMLRGVRTMRRFPEMFTGSATPLGRDFEEARALADRLPDDAFDAISPQLDALDGEVVAAVRAAVAVLPTSAPDDETIAALVTEQPELRSLSLRRVNAAVRAARDAGLEITPSTGP